MNKYETLNHNAGAPSGFAERFDYKIYNPKILITPQK